MYFLLHNESGIYQKDFRYDALHLQSQYLLEFKLMYHWKFLQIKYGAINPPIQLILKLHYLWDHKNQFHNNEISHFAVTLHWGQKLASTAIHLI
jgi:hypothetical protein